MYRYRVRPGYGSTELLIELLPKSADKAFDAELMKVLEQLNGKVTDTDELWMNDEVVLNFVSDVGPFEVSISSWDIVFIHAPNNQNAIVKIEEALQANAKFQQEIVDFEQYKKLSQ